MNRPNHLNKTRCINRRGAAAAIILALALPLVITLLLTTHLPTTPHHIVKQTVILVQAAYSPHPAADPQELRRLLLKLTNIERQNAGVPPVRTGRNPAPQLHAEDNLRHRYSSHWDRHGLKPNHRHSLTGGTGADGENIFASNHCPDIKNPLPPIRPLTTTVAHALKAWMNSPGHRANILDPAHTLLHAGIAHDQCALVIVQLFDSDYVNYTTHPHIDVNGNLSMTGRINRATLKTPHQVKVTVGYDPPPKNLTRAQLAHTHSLCTPAPAAYLTAPRELTEQHPHQEHIVYASRCVDPYLTKPAPDPATPQQAHKAWMDAKAKIQHQPATKTAYMTAIATDRTNLASYRFSIAADLTPVLNAYGPGIYTISLWGRPFHMEETTVLARTSIFWKTSPHPDNPYRPRTANGAW